MDVSLVLRPAMGVIGAVIAAAGFLCLARKKMTVNLALVAEFLGAALVIIAAVPAFSAWTQRLALGTGIALTAVGAVGVLGVFQVMLMISKLQMREEELAVQVSLLLEENQRLAERIEKLEASGKGVVHYQLIEPGRGGDSSAEEAEYGVG